MIMEEEVWEERPAFSDLKKEKKPLHKQKEKDKDKDKKEKKHKHNKHKKDKKKNKERGEKRKKHDNSESGSGSEDSEEGDEDDDDVKKPKPTQSHNEIENEKTNDDNATITKSATVQRESWMTSAPSDSNWLLGSRVSVEEKKPTQEEIDKEQSVPVGLTVRDNDNNNNNTSNIKDSNSNNKAPSWMVGDGGQSWRARALRRAREQASESGESVDSLVESRFGSIEELQKRTHRGRNEETGPPHHYHYHNDRDRERGRERDHHQERGPDRDRNRESQRDREKERDGERERNKGETERNGAPFDYRKEGDNNRYREQRGRVFEDPSKRMMAPSNTDLKWGSRKSPHSDPKTIHSSSSTTSSTSSRSSPQPSERFQDKREDKAESENVQREKVRNENNCSNNSIGKSEESEPASSQGVDINKLVAQVLKAKLKGDKELVKKLEQEIEEAKRALNKVVVKIPMMDLNGRQMVGNDKTDANLQTLLSKERYAGSKDYDYEYASALIKTKKGMLTDDDYDQIGEEKIPKQKKKEEKSKQKQQEKEKQQVISNFKRAEAQERNCWFCYTSNTFDKSLMVSTGNHVYLSLPSKGTLAPGHCLIVPIRHTISVTSVDEDVFTEIQNFKKCLIQMMASLQKECIFLETVMNLKKQNHTFLECIPLSPELSENAPFYYKKALSESESEWAQHKKIIDTRGKGIKKCVPEGFPYFHVEFGYNGGFAHVIEDEIDFPRWFGKEVVGGMLELGPEYWRHPKSHTDQEKRITKERFAKLWDPYNWTKALD